MILGLSKCHSPLSKSVILKNTLTNTVRQPRRSNVNLGFKLFTALLARQSERFTTECQSPKQRIIEIITFNQRGWWSNVKECYSESLFRLNWNLIQKWNDIKSINSRILSTCQCSFHLQTRVYSHCAGFECKMHILCLYMFFLHLITSLHVLHIFFLTFPKVLICFTV